MEGLFPKDAKKTSKVLLGGILAGALVLGLGSCAAIDFVKNRLGGNKAHDIITKPSPSEVVRQSPKTIHAQALISVTYNPRTNKCEIIWE